MQSVQVTRYVAECGTRVIKSLTALPTHTRTHAVTCLDARGARPDPARSRLSARPRATPFRVPYRGIHRYTCVSIIQTRNVVTRKSAFLFTLRWRHDRRCGNTARARARGMRTPSQPPPPQPQLITVRRSVALAGTGLKLLSQCASACRRPCQTARRARLPPSRGATPAVHDVLGDIRSNRICC